jgi:hypothetical protein
VETSNKFILTDDQLNKADLISAQKYLDIARHFRQLASDALYRVKVRTNPELASVDPDEVDVFDGVL